MVISHDPLKKFHPDLARSLKINFMGINETQQAKPMKQIFIEV